MLVILQACQHPTQHDLAASCGAWHHGPRTASAGSICPGSLSSSHVSLETVFQATCVVQDRADAASAAAGEAITDAYLHPYTQLLLDGPVPQYVRMQQPASEEQQREQLGGRFSGKKGCPRQLQACLTPFHILFRPCWRPLSSSQVCAGDWAAKRHSILALAQRPPRATQLGTADAACSWAETIFWAAPQQCSAVA